MKRCKLETIKEALRCELNQYHYFDKAIIKLTLIYLLGIFAIIRADYKYIDDLRRVHSGYQGWGSSFSRYMSDFISNIIHADSYLTDVSPLPQMIAVLLLGIAGIFSISVLSEKRKKVNWWQIIAAIPMGLSPYFLECLSYKYDAPYMALSVLASIVPIVFLKYGYLIYSAITMVSLLIMLTTYQASSGIYPMLVCIVCVNAWNSGSKFGDELKTVCVSAANYIAALLIYKFFIMTEVDTYVSSGIAQLDQIVPQLAQYYKSLFADFKNWWLVLVVAIVLFYVFVSVRETKQNKLLSFLINFVSVFLCACLCFGIYPFLSKPLYAPRAMYGVGVFIAFLGITTVSKNKTFISKIVCCALAWTFFSFSFTYGNALAEQERYTEFRIEMVINDLNDLEIFTSDNVVTVQLQGNIGDSPVLSNMPKTYAILDKLVPSTFGNGWVWSEYYFYNYFKLKNVRTDGSIDLTTYNLPVLIDNMYCTIQGNEEYVLIRLK